MSAFRPGFLAGRATAGLLVGCMVAVAARADMVLLSDTTLVTGTESSVYSFNAPGPGTVTVQLTSLAWPQALNSLSFMASTPSQVLSWWSDPSSQPATGPQGLTFQVNGAGTYFADVTAAAGGALDLGVYSLSLTFTPAGTVPLPPSGLLLAGALALIFGWYWRHRATPGAQPPGDNRAL